MKCFDDQRCLSRSEESKCESGALFTMCSCTFIVFWFRKTSTFVEMFQLSFCVFMCAFHLEISSFFGKSFLFLFLLFVLTVLWNFPLHVVSKIIMCFLSILRSDFLEVYQKQISIWILKQVVKKSYIKRKILFPRTGLNPWFFVLVKVFNQVQDHG